ncbi:nucleotidyltransferase domain-containing protein [uncultured Clostridium sp.]|uniref:nucleotidyltransferase domain-containing protein n=1 Tax=uncultured Clostridium sp. TaxID=59620 RepID=UPI0028E52DB7|nr:nucleotidyltransferase domain-containing protein [uncultured Clostridium sp.]
MQFPTKIGVDIDGYIINQTSKDKISYVYQKTLEEILDILKECTGDKVHSVYIYGSVGRGEAVLGSSDIDLSVVLTSSLTPLETTTLNQETKNFICNNPNIPKVDYDMGLLDDVNKNENLYSWGFWLKHICTCIYGEDLSIQFPRMKPNINIAKSLNQDIINTLDSYKKSIIEEDFDNSMLLSALKRIVRGAYCLISVIDNSWSANIQENLVILQHYFPKENFLKKIEKALLNRENLSPKDVLDCINYFTIWFKNNAKENVVFSN